MSQSDLNLLRAEAFDQTEQARCRDALEAINRRRAERKPTLKALLGKLPAGHFLSDGHRVWQLGEHGAIESFPVHDAARFGEPDGADADLEAAAREFTPPCECQDRGVELAFQAWREQQMQNGQAI